MAFRLKDKELQDKLDALTDGIKFSDQLQECYEIALRGGKFDDDERFNVWFGEKIGKLYKYIAAFKQDEVEELQEHEEVQEYNPNAWNYYPAVKPPEGVWMRVELNNPDGSVFRDVARFVDDDGQYYWVDQINNDMPNFRVARFRPWED